MLEVFKKIEGYPDYAISNFGRVLSLPRKGVRKERFRKTNLNKHGYLCFTFRTNKIMINLRIHRLIAEHFIPNPFNLPYVDHIDQDKLNNQINNLRWVFPFDNCHNIDSAQIRSKLQIRHISYSDEKNKYVFQKTIRGKQHIRRFNTLEEAIEYKKKYLAENINI